jgi:flagellar hook-associated protein 2
MGKTAASQDNAGILAGDNTMLRLGESLQNLISKQVSGTSGLSSLASLGVKTNNDGTLTIDDAAFTKAFQSSPTDLDTLFTNTTDGIGKVVKDLTKSYLDPVNGLLVSYQQGMNDEIKALTDDMTSEQSRINSYQQSLIDQFNALEQTMASLKTSGNYMSQVFGSSSSGSSSSSSSSKSSG